jgi:hypothetical protein
LDKPDEKVCFKEQKRLHMIINFNGLAMRKKNNNIDSSVAFSIDLICEKLYNSDVGD